jgi:hypothetical protein
LTQPKFATCREKGSTVFSETANVQACTLRSGFFICLDLVTVDDIENLVAEIATKAKLKRTIYI